MMQMMSDDVELYSVVCVLSVLSVLGAAGNLIVLYVFSRPTRHDLAGATAVCPSPSATVYIMALAATDFVTCSVNIPSTIYMEWIVYRTRCDFFCRFYQVRYFPRDVTCQP